MIGQLRGIILEKQPPQLVLDVNGVGYEIDAPMSTFYQLPEIGQTITLLTHFVVREDAHHLYGFYTRDERSLFKGQARGAVIVALDMPVTEYSAREVKKSVVGSGAADKSQVQYMVSRLLNLKTALQADEADALAVALCHAQSRHVKKLTSLIEGAMHA